MKIKVLSRKYFEQIQGSSEESRLLDACKIIAIQSSHGFYSVPPFSSENLSSPHLLCLTFDDIANEAETAEDLIGCAYFNSIVKTENLHTTMVSKCRANLEFGGT